MCPRNTHTPRRMRECEREVSSVGEAEHEQTFTAQQCIIRFGCFRLGDKNRLAPKRQTTAVLDSPRRGIYVLQERSQPARARACILRYFANYMMRHACVSSPHPTLRTLRPCTTRLHCVCRRQHNRLLPHTSVWHKNILSLRPSDERRKLHLEK